MDAQLARSAMQWRRTKAALSKKLKRERCEVYLCHTKAALSQRKGLENGLDSLL